MARFVALLRAVNVGGRKMPMADLRALCATIGLEQTETYIQSGNLVFAAAGTAAAVAARLEDAIERRFGFRSDVVVRTADQWRALIAANPFPEESETEPNRVLAGLARTKLASGASAAIAAKAAAGERVAQAGEVLWFHYPAGVGTSRITPALIDRAAGSPVTARNWRTLLKLQEMIEP